MKRKENYIPIHVRPPLYTFIRYDPYTSYPSFTNQPRYPALSNYMTYSIPTEVIPDCVCDASETYGECQFRKRYYHCEHELSYS